jgi:hypothetical protein
MTWLTCDCGPAHQVCVGEVERRVEQEVGLNDASGPLTGIIEQTSAPQWDTTLIAVLQVTQ